MNCHRCSQDKQGLPAPPFGGALGEKIHQGVCADCWSEWQAAQIIFINEQRLSLADPKSQEALTAEMKRFLGLEG